MENQTRFDLNAAVENWRHELAAQPPLAPDNRRELETHLRDALAELKARGLNDEESFWLARHRIGQPQKLAEEFVKADPAKVWRERIFWMALALLLTFLWNDCAAIFRVIISNTLNNQFGQMSGWSENIQPVVNGLLMFLNILPVLGLALLLAKGRLRDDSILRPFSQRRFAISILVSLWITVSGVMLYRSTAAFNKILAETNNLIATMPRTEGMSYVTATPQPAWMALSYTVIFPLVLLAIILWLMPAQNQKIPKHE